ncbi:MAG: nucleotidyltransferase domain-containing protein [Tunicatimonas sp.]
MSVLVKNTTPSFGFSEEVLNLLVSVFTSVDKIKKVVVFGSRAKGNYHPGSDIDLAVFAADFTHNDLVDLQLKIEDLTLLYQVDCINYATITNAALREHIDRVGQPLYPTKPLSLEHNLEG